MGAWDLVVILFAVAGIAWAVSHLIRRETVLEHQHAVKVERGKLTGALEPGVYWLFAPNASITRIDARLRVMTVAGQEVLSSDGVSLKLSALLEYRVVDPTQAILSAESYDERLYASVQVALREAVGERAIESVLETRAELANRIRSSVEPVGATLGVELETVAVKDIMFPGALKEAFSQTARAKQEAQAGLERARGEAAVLRNLANTARLLDGNPALSQLRLLQTAEHAGKLVLNVSAPEGPSSPSDG